MVDKYGRWTEENDYNTYPEEKWCDYDYMSVWIRNKSYEPKTTMDNLITMIFSHFECEMENDKNLYFTIENCKEYVESSGGLKEFDYEC